MKLDYKANNFNMVLQSNFTSIILFDIENKPLS